MRALRPLLPALLFLAGCAPAPLAPTNAPEVPATVLATPGLARLVTREAAASFDAYDADHDGMLSRVEAPFLLPETWSRLDADGDGRLSAAEGRPTAAEQAISRGLLAKSLWHLFRGLDRDGDLRLTTAEAAPLGLSGGDFAGLVEALAAPPAPLPAPEAGAPRRPALVLVPGFFLPTTIWVPLSRRLAARGWTHQVTVPHFPSFGDIREYAAAAAFRARQVMAAAGSEQVDLVGHSMGGLVLRHYLKELGGTAHARRYVSFGTPQHGTEIGRLWPCTSTGQMLPGSDFLTRLNAGDETPGAVDYTSIRTNTDEIVLSTTSPVLEGASNHLVPVAGHLELVWDPRSQAIALEALER